MSMPKNCQITKTKELGIVPRMHALFPRWIAIEIPCVINITYILHFVHEIASLVNSGILDLENSSSFKVYQPSRVVKSSIYCFPMQAVV